MLRKVRNYLKTRRSPGKWSDMDLGLPVAEMFRRVVSDGPARVAVQGQSGALTYQELDVKSDQVAWALITETGGPSGPEPRPVGIFAGQDEHAVIGMMGCLKAGRPFVFLSPEDPPERRHLIAGLADVTVVLAGQGKLDAARELAREHHASVIDLPTMPATAAASFLRRSAPPQPGAASDLALVFTSGQTGRPVGVRRSQRCQLHLVRHLVRRCGITPSDRLAMIIPPSFGACLNDVFLALLTGATLFPLSLPEDRPRLLNWLAGESITYCHCVPSVFRAIARQADATPGGALPALRWFKLGGEPLFPADLDFLRTRFSPKVKALFSYGSTETGGTITDHVLDAHASPPDMKIPAGRPIPGKEVLIVDQGGRSLPPGEPGEIVVRSAYLSAGYFRDGERTALRFQEDPHSPGSRLFHTRDLGQLDALGNLHHLGRLDGQIKLRGIGINPSEIEARFCEHPAILDCAVVPSVDGSRLDAFLVGADPEATLEHAALQSHLSGRMPRGMFPHQVHYLPVLPRLANGKADRLKLREMAANHRVAQDPWTACKPRTGLERIIAAIWKRLLGRDSMGVYDNFFQMGGDSLAAVSFQADLTAQLNLELPAAALLGGNPTIASMAEQLRHNYLLGKEHHGPVAALEVPFPTLVQIRPGGTQPPVFFLPGGYGSEAEMMFFARMASHIDASRPLYGFRATTLYQLDPPPESVEMVARCYLREMESLAREHPPVLVGHCVAGMVAFEMAALLEKEHGPEARPSLILIESASRRGWRRRQNTAANEAAANASHPRFAKFYFDLLSDHVPATYGGSAHLLVSETFFEPDEPTLGWKNHILGGIQVSRMPGDHHDLVRKNRDSLGKALANLLASLAAASADPSEKRPDAGPDHRVPPGQAGEIHERPVGYPAFPFDSRGLKAEETGPSGIRVPER